jgi:CheY-like chemotaxis protein
MERTPRNDPQDRPAGAGSRILVIDDERTIHISLTRILGRQGHHVDAVYGAPEALQLLASREYDLVITDLMMPEMNGMELLRKMREQGHEAPVLMITGYPTIRTALEALRLGAVDYVAKPFTREELLGPVRRTLRRPAAGASADPAPAGPASGADEQPPAPQPSPGDRFFLREHSWAEYERNGTVRIGIEASFLDTVDAITGLKLPGDDEIVEQGLAGIRVETATGEQHSVFVPLSGRVVEVNAQALDDPGSVDSATWLVRVQPQRLEAELPLLLRA